MTSFVRLVLGYEPLNRCILNHSSLFRSQSSFTRSSSPNNMFNIHKISKPTDSPISHTFLAATSSKTAGLQREREKSELLGRQRFSLSVKRTRWEVYEGHNGETVVESAVERQG